MTSSSATSPGSPEHALDSGPIPVSTEKRRATVHRPDLPACLPWPRYAALTSGSGRWRSDGGRRPNGRPRKTPCQELQDIPSLLAAGRRHGQDPLDEPTAPRADRPATRLAPQDGVPQRPLRRVIRRLDPTHPEEGPQVLLALQQLPARRPRLLAGARRSSFFSRCAPAMPIVNLDEPSASTGALALHIRWRDTRRVPA